MAAFEYLALDPQGRQHKGLLEADSPRQARQLLREKQLAPLQIQQTRSREQASSGRFGLAQSLGARDLAMLTRQLATLVQAALPIEEALRAAAAQSTTPKIKSMLLAVRGRVLEGHSLAASLKEYPAAFPELYRATVAAGEHAGHLGLVLDQLADYTEQRQQSRQKIQMALLYPVILMVASLTIVASNPETNCSRRESESGWSRKTKTRTTMRSVPERYKPWFPGFPCDARPDRPRIAKAVP